MAYKGPTRKGPYYKSFRVDNPELLLPCRKQLADVCWAIATTGQFDAALKLEKGLFYEEKLSVQELINLMSRGELKAGGAIKDIRSIGDPLMNVGTVKDSDCPLKTYSLNDEPQVYGIVETPDEDVIPYEVDVGDPAPNGSDAEEIPK